MVDLCPSVLGSRGRSRSLLIFWFDFENAASGRLGQLSSAGGEEVGRVSWWGGSKVPYIRWSL